MFFQGKSVWLLSLCCRFRWRDFVLFARCKENEARETRVGECFHTRSIHGAFLPPAMYPYAVRPLNRISFQGSVSYFNCSEGEGSSPNSISYKTLCRVTETLPALVSPQPCRNTAKNPLPAGALAPPCSNPAASSNSRRTHCPFAGSARAASPGTRRRASLP